MGDGRRPVGAPVPAGRVEGSVVAGGRFEAAAVVAVALAAVAFVWFIARPRGLGVTNDGVAYLATSDSLLAGHGAGYWLQQPLTSWPLLYPALLAAVRRVSGTDGLDAALVVALLTAAALPVLAWRAARRVVRRPPVRLAVVAVAALAPAVVVLVDKVLTDALFAAGTIALVLVLQRAVSTGSVRWIVAGAVVVDLLFLTRYVGGGYLALGALALVVLPLARPAGRRWRDAVLFVVVGAVVPAAYAFRNRSVSGAWLGQDRATSTGSALGSLGVVPRSVVGWAVTRSADRPLVTLVGIVLLAGLVALAVVLVRRGRGADVPPDGAAPAAGEGGPTDAVPGSVDLDRAVLALFWLGLVGYLVALRLVVFFDLDARTVLPLFPLTVLLVAVTVEEALDRMPGAAGTALLAGFGAWALFVVAIGVHDGLAFRREGSGYLERDHDLTYAELDRADLPGLLPPGCTRYSNQPNLLYFAGVEAALTPTRADLDPATGAARPPGGEVCVVWFPGGEAEALDLAPLDPVVAGWGLESVYDGEQVDVYLGGR